jgi:hypothetical protein
VSAGDITSDSMAYPTVTMSRVVEREPRSPGAWPWTNSDWHNACAANAAASAATAPPMRAGTAIRKSALRLPRLSNEQDRIGLDKHE